MSDVEDKFETEVLKFLENKELRAEKKYKIGKKFDQGKPIAGAEKNKIGKKFDQGKPIAGAIQDFNLALEQLAILLTLGANKYERSSWKTVPNGEERYKDGLWRHLLEVGDVEGGLPHDIAVIFNALATVQLRLERELKENENLVKNISK